MTEKTQVKETDAAANLRLTMPALAHWLEDPSEYINDRWQAIGTEVYARKTLVLSAAAALKANDVPHSLRLAATDVLIEKAQLQLTERADQMNLGGALLYVMSVVLLAASGWMMYSVGGVLPKPADLSGYVLTLAILRTSTAAGLLFSGIYFMIALAKALLREGALLLNRRHALRYLRLCVYLTDGDVKLEQLKEMFNWNADFTTAFQDIDTDKASSPVNKMTEVFATALKGATEQAARMASRNT